MVVTFDNDIAGQNHGRDEIGTLLREQVCVQCDIFSDQDVVTGSKLPQRIHHVIIHAMSVSILASWS